MDKVKRKGKVSGYNIVYTFTRKNIKTGEYWAEDYPVLENRKIVYGKWIPADEIEFVE